MGFNTVTTGMISTPHCHQNTAHPVTNQKTEVEANRFSQDRTRENWSGPLSQRLPLLQCINSFGQCI